MICENSKYRSESFVCRGRPRAVGCDGGTEAGVLQWGDITVGRVLWWLVIAACACRVGLGANPVDGRNPHVWDGRVTSVSVFKNGLGFFTQEAEAELRDGWCLVEKIPPAAFGTLAVYCLDEDHLVDVVGTGPGETVEFDGVDAPDDVAAVRKRLEQSKHLNVQLFYDTKGESRQAAGKVVSVGPEFVILEGVNNSFAVPLDGITKMRILELPMRVHVTSDGDKAVKKTRLGIAYLRKGITWIPEYTVKILDEDTAELTLRGTVVNEAEDLIHCDVNFFVGVPHFAHTQYMAPIAVGQTIRHIAASAAPGQVTTQIMNRAQIVSNTLTAGQGAVVEQPMPIDAGDLGSTMGNLPKIDGGAGADYTVYTKKDMTLRRGEKGIVTLFVKKIRYSHVYRWSPPERIEHFLVLHNQTDTAWTTGPYLAIDQQRPLSQDLLKYTPRAGQCEIPVTQAVNISHDQQEAEIERQLKAHNPAPNYYLDLVQLEGTLKLINFEKEAVRVVVSVAVAGRPLSASEDGAVRADSSQLKLTERRGTVSWTLKLEPKEAKTLTYQYERYVPSR